MKRSVALAAFVVFLFTLSLAPAQHADASQAYSEKITAYIAGSNALWFMTFDGVNASSPSISAVEAVSGVNWYNLTLLKTSSWSSDFQVFGPNGYNLIPTPFVPNQGAFLRVGADSYSAALSAAVSIGSFLLTSFVSYSNSSGIYTFFAPLSFSDIAPSTVLKFTPSSMGGFASAISLSNFSVGQSPIVSLQGIREVSGFSHNLTLGSIASGAVGSSYQPTLLSYFGRTISFLQAANKSSSSTIYIRFLDGQVNSTDKAAVVANVAGSGSYELSLEPGHKVRSLNVTVDQTPSLLLVSRSIDRGVLMHDQNVSVTISLSVPAGTPAVKTTAFSDDWWKQYGFFRLVEGNSTIPVLTVTATSPVTPTYILEYTGNITQQLIIPPTSVAYSYTVGSAQFSGRSDSNPLSLSLGVDNPVLYAFLVPSGNFEGAVGAVQKYNITVKNVGTLTASSEFVAGQPEGGLVAGSSITVQVPVTAQALTAAAMSKDYAVSYSAPSGQNFTIFTNSEPLLFTHATISIGMPTLTLGTSVARLQSGKTNLTLTFEVANRGSANLVGFEASGKLPAGLSCGTSRGSGVACSADQVTLSFPALSSSKTANSSMEFDLSSGVNYFFAPFSFRATTAGITLAGESNAVATPSGVVLTKLFVPSSAFAGMSIAVQLRAENAGPFTAYNVTLQSTADTFDTVAVLSSLPVKFAQQVGPGGDLNVSYTVLALGTFGNLTSSETSVKMYFGGTPYTITQAGPRVSVYRPLTVSIGTSPFSPTEGKPFSIGVTIKNPSSAAVSNVKFSLPIPSSMTISNLKNAVYGRGDLNISVSQLGSGQSYIANATAQASSGVSVQFSAATLSFTYSGAVVKSPAIQGEIVVGEDVLTRYTLPSIIALVGVLATAIYIRKKVSPISLENRQ